MHEHGTNERLAEPESSSCSERVQEASEHVDAESSILVY
jgi:hypothetical protein